LNFKEPSSGVVFNFNRKSSGRWSISTRQKPWTNGGIRRHDLHTSADLLEAAGQNIGIHFDAPTVNGGILVI
jgi:hypothetical protein